MYFFSAAAAWFSLRLLITFISGSKDSFCASSLLRECGFENGGFGGVKMRAALGVLYLRTECRIHARSKSGLIV